MRNTFLFISFLICTSSAIAQIVPIGQPISTALTDDFNPSVSGNGKTLLYEVIYRNSNKADVMIANQISGNWSQPAVVNGVNTATEQLTNGGYFINHTGNIILFHSNRYKGIGGTDIWYTEKNESGVWSAPMNFGKPINGIGNEIDPSLSPDGRFLYFTVLSDKKTTAGLPCGKIMVAERISSTTWKTPVPLPAPINGDCECGGKLLSDNKTFLFSSMRSGGKGGYDFYKSTLNADGTFSAPINYAFINTADDDKYISVAAGGSMLYAAAPGKGKDERDIVRTKIPEDMQPDMVRLYQGKVMDANTNKPLSAQITVTNPARGTTMVYRTAADGSFSVPIPSAEEYDVSVFSSAPGFDYISFITPASPVKKYEEKNVTFTLHPLAKGTVIPLSNLTFNDVREINKTGTLELNRIKLLLRLNPAAAVEIIAYTNEIITDTIKHPPVDKEMINPVDSTIIYSNDHSEEEAKYIYDYLIKNGVAADKLSYTGAGTDDSDDDGPDIDDADRKKKYELVVK